MDHPILNGESGFILLALVVGLGAYIRQVYVDSEVAHDKLKSGKLENLWGSKAPYTIDRLANLRDVQDNLLRATKILFFLTVLLSLRLIAYAITVIPTGIACVLNFMRIPNSGLYYIDLFLLVYLLVAFSMMWRMHHYGSKKERECRKAMWAAFEGRQSPPQSN